MESPFQFKNDIHVPFSGIDFSVLANSSLPSRGSAAKLGSRVCLLTKKHTVLKLPGLKGISRGKMLGLSQTFMKNSDFVFGVFGRGRHRSFITVVTALLANQILSWFLNAHCRPRFFAMYIDPGSGLLMWQLLAATLAGFVFNTRQQIVRLIRRLWSDEER